MPTSIIAPRVLGPVIKHEGKCYEFAYLTNEAADTPAAEEFETCEDCASGSSTAPSSEEPSSDTPSSTGACAGLDCSGDPSMEVTVTGASGTINWVGETWNLPDDSGLTKCVCPTTYIKQRSPTGGAIGNSHATHEWVFYTAYYEILILHRYFGGSLNFGWENILRVKGGPNYDWEDGSGVNYSGLGIIIGGPAAAYSDYLITDAFFSSTTISGITYTWAKGNDWP